MKTFRIALLALLAPCAALANSTSDIDASGGSLVPSLGITIGLSGESSLPSASGSSHAIELGYAAARAKDRDRLRVGDNPIVVGDQTFTGAQDLNYSQSIQFADLAYRYRRWLDSDSRFAVEVLGGAGWAALNLKVDGAAQSAQERLNNAGVLLGVGALWRFLPNTALQARAMGMFSGSTEGVTRAGRFEVTLTQALGRHAQLRAGLGALSVYSARENDGDSNSAKSPIRASAGGLVLGFDLLF
jgi:hypothetical protein